MTARVVKQLAIKNFKSITNETIDLGRINVFIGENGSGKTNILEAAAMGGAAESNRLTVQDMSNRGIRVARPGLMASAFEAGPSSEQVAESVLAGRGSHVQVSTEIDVDGDTTRLAYNLLPRAREPNEGSWRAFPRIGPLTEKMQARTKNWRSRAAPDQLAQLPPEEQAERMRQYLADPFGVGEVLGSFVIYSAETPALRGLTNLSLLEPLGLSGENLDVFLSRLQTTEPEAYQEILSKAHMISWLDDLVFDEADALKLQGHKLGRSTSRLYFRDRFLNEATNVFSAENANEGILHILFYLALFATRHTPSIFGIDNIETALNPGLCSALIEEIARLAKKNEKQALITTHNPAVLDGLNLHDPDQRLFVVSRGDEGSTKCKRIELKPPQPDTGRRMKLSELWTRGHLGAIPRGF